MNNRRASLQSMPGVINSHELTREYVNRDVAGFEGWLLDRMIQIVVQARQRHAALCARHPISHQIPDIDLVAVMEQLAYAKELSRLQELSQLLKLRISLRQSVTVGQAANTVDFTRSLGLAIILTVSLFPQTLITNQQTAMSSLPPAPTGAQYRYCESPSCNVLILTPIAHVRKGDWLVSCQQALHQQLHL